LTRIDTTDAGREQINAGQSVSAEYIMRSDLTQDVTQYKKLKGIGILISVKVNSNIVC
jgi:hypothetical protein